MSCGKNEAQRDGTLRAATVCVKRKSHYQESNVKINLSNRFVSL
jgi:hypothetical protein